VISGFAEDAAAAGSHGGCGHERLDQRFGKLLEIDTFLDNVAQRIEAGSD
jgi:hypothetical protein